MPDRLGSGRSAIYRGRYLKGVGRTPAAANWNEPGDRYHGSGHLSVASALRERLITRFLETAGLGWTIVPCEGLLLRALSPAERRRVASGRTSSVPRVTPADGRLAALSVKPADFARPTNVVFALDRICDHPRRVGEIFLALERYLLPPGERRGIEGDPAAIAGALDGAVRRTLAAFAAFARVGLSWGFVPGNFTLDGRFVDLETPLLFGAPFVGTMIRHERGAPATRRLIGLEAFEAAVEWRRFLAWLRSHLRLLAAPGFLSEPLARTFIRDLGRRIDARFSRRHVLFDDARLEADVVRNLLPRLDLGARGRAELRELARLALGRAAKGGPGRIPDLGWRPVRFRPAPPTPTPCRFEAPRFLDPGPAPSGEAFAATLERLGAELDPRALIRAVGREGRS